MATLRYRFESVGGFRGALGGQVDAADEDPLLSGNLSVTSSATSGGSQPTATVDCFVTLIAVDAPAYVDIGTTPDPTAEPRLLAITGVPVRVHVASGHKLSAVLATDIPNTTVAQDAAVALTDRSGTVTAGGAAQNACAANTSRKLLIVSNPSDTLTFTFRTDATATATGTAGSIAVGPGGGYIFDKVVPSGAVSIYGATTGQPFTVKEA
jgi:hypothetical protein